MLTLPKEEAFHARQALLTTGDNGFGEVVRWNSDILGDGTHSVEIPDEWVFDTFWNIKRRVNYWEIEFDQREETETINGVTVHWPTAVKAYKRIYERWQQLEKQDTVLLEQKYAHEIWKFLLGWEKGYEAYHAQCGSETSAEKLELIKNALAGGNRDLHLDIATADAIDTYLQMKLHDYEWEYPGEEETILKLGGQSIDQSIALQGRYILFGWCKIKQANRPYELWEQLRLHGGGGYESPERRKELQEIGRQMARDLYGPHEKEPSS